MKQATTKNNGFTLIEMIGVLAIIGILAAVVAPRVIESIRDAKVTSAISSVNAAKVAALNYYQRYDRFLLDSTIVDIKDNRNGGTVTDLNFGSLLYYQEQLLESIQTPIGEEVGDKTWAIGCVDVEGAMDAGGGSLSYTGTVRFKSAGNASRIVYYFFPNLTTQEAEALSTKINGPFPANFGTGDGEGVIESFTATATPPAGIEGANCWFDSSSDNSHDAYLYVSHQ